MKPTIVNLDRKIFVEKENTKLLDRFLVGFFRKSFHRLFTRFILRMYEKGNVDSEKLHSIKASLDRALRWENYLPDPPKPLYQEQHYNTAVNEDDHSEQYSKPKDLGPNHRTHLELTKVEPMPVATPRDNHWQELIDITDKVRMKHLDWKEGGLNVNVWKGGKKIYGVISSPRVFRGTDIIDLGMIVKAALKEI